MTYEERNAAWHEWRAEFRKIWKGDPSFKALDPVLRKAFELNTDDTLLSLYGKILNVKAHKRILELSPILASSIESIAKASEISLEPEGAETLAVILIPKLEDLCRKALGIAEIADYRLLDEHFDRSKISDQEWLSAKTVVLINLFGGRFRNRRLDWKEQGKKQKIIRSTDVAGETQEAMKQRIECEVNLEEPWGKQLESVTVIIASKKLFSRWLKGDGGGRYESPDATRLFWKLYLAKLSKNAADARAAGPRKRKPFDVELLETDHLDFVCHGFNWDRPGSVLRGTHLCCGAAAPLGFEVNWPLGETIPPHYEVFKRAIENVRRFSKPIKIPSA